MEIWRAVYELSRRMNTALVEKDAKKTRKENRKKIRWKRKKTKQKKDQKDERTKMTITAAKRKLDSHNIDNLGRKNAAPNIYSKCWCRTRNERLSVYRTQRGGKYYQTCARTYLPPFTHLPSDHKKNGGKEYDDDDGDEDSDEEEAHTVLIILRGRMLCTTYRAMISRMETDDATNVAQRENEIQREREALRGRKVHPDTCAYMYSRSLIFRTQSKCSTSSREQQFVVIKTSPNRQLG